MDDVFDEEREKPCLTLDEYLDDLEERELEAEMVLGGDDGDECTYSKGYMKRQAIFSCLTCTPEGNAGICTACSMSCHEGHEVLELWTKRNLRCDCGNSKFGDFICKLQPNKDIENTKNSYNHNFKGTYCTCDRPYPDPDVEEEEEMIQCCVCEDWFHREHLDLESLEKIPVDEEGEPVYDELICQGCSAVCSFLTLYPRNTFVAPKKHAMVANDEKGKGILEEVPSECASSENVTDGEGSISPIMSEKDPSLNKCSQDASSGATCRVGVDLAAAAPVQEGSKAMFLVRNWRDILCRCEKCLNFYYKKSLGFLLDKDESIVEYEKRAKERREERMQQQEGATLNMFNNMGHVEKVEIMSGIADMKNEMENFFATQDASKAVTSADIYQFFDNLKAKRRRHMVERVEGEKEENRVEQSKVNFGEDVVIQKDDDSKKKNTLRVKVVVTKEELQWLMMQLSNKEGDGNNNKKIQDVLGELQKGRKRLSPGWKPSLDSISEIPEVLEMHR